MIPVPEWRPLTTNFESDLFAINDSNLVELKLIDKKIVKQDYDIRGRGIGVVITMRKK